MSLFSRKRPVQIEPLHWEVAYRLAAGDTPEEAAAYVSGKGLGEVTGRTIQNWRADAAQDAWFARMVAQAQEEVLADVRLRARSESVETKAGRVEIVNSVVRTMMDAMRRAPDGSAKASLGSVALRAVSEGRAEMADGPKDGALPVLDIGPRPLYDLDQEEANG